MRLTDTFASLAPGDVAALDMAQIVGGLAAWALARGLFSNALPLTRQ
jgi:hypothetical protein